MSGPVTIDGALCNETARRVFHKALEVAEKEIGKPDFDAPKVAALAQLADACGNDFLAGEDE